MYILSLHKYQDLKGIFFLYLNTKIWRVYSLALHKYQGIYSLALHKYQDLKGIFFLYINSRSEGYILSLHYYQDLKGIYFLYLNTKIWRVYSLALHKYQDLKGIYFYITHNPRVYVPKNRFFYFWENYLVKSVFVLGYNTPPPLTGPNNFKYFNPQHEK